MININLILEESLPDHSYKTIWKGKNIEQIQEGLDNLSNNKTTNRLELWSAAQTSAPLAYREENSSQLMIHPILKMLMGQV
jgi:hypothetical protein